MASWEENRTDWELIGCLKEKHIEERICMAVCMKPSV